MARDTDRSEEVSNGPEHWEGRSQSDWDGSCVVITRKEDKGRARSPETSGPLGNDSAERN